MKLLKSIPIPGTIEKSVAALGNLSYSNRYVAVSLTDATVHIFSILDASHLFSFQDPCGEYVWAHAIVDNTIITGNKDGLLRA